MLTLSTEVAPAKSVLVSVGLILGFGLANMTEIDFASCSGLYPKLLGDSWDRLDNSVRRIHAYIAPVQAVGVFKVRGGSNGLARLLARLARLPVAGEAVSVRLLVTARGDREEWRRTFAGQPLVTLQSERRDGLLAERIGPLEMRFRLEVVSGALWYKAARAAFCLGPLRLPLPSWLSPRLTAWEKPIGEEGQIDVFVQVDLPLLGGLVGYSGTLTREGT